MSDVSVGHSDEQVGCKGNCHSLGEWRHLVSYQVAQSRTGGHSDMTARMCSRRIRCECKPLSFQSIPQIYSSFPEDLVLFSSLLECVCSQER